MRTISNTIVFTRPFVLSGFNGIQPAGSYLVETDALHGTADPIWRRRLTLSRLHPHPGSDQRATVCASELDAALLRDSAATALRHETGVRRAHRTSMQAFFETMASERIAYPGAIDPGADR